MMSAKCNGNGYIMKTQSCAIFMSLLAFCCVSFITLYAQRCTAAGQPAVEEKLVMDFVQNGNCGPAAVAKLGKRECKDFRTVCSKKFTPTEAEKVQGVEEKTCFQVEWMQRFEDTPWRPMTRNATVTLNNKQRSVVESEGQCCAGK